MKYPTYRHALRALFTGRAPIDPAVELAVTRRTETIARLATLAAAGTPGGVLIVFGASGLNVRTTIGNTHPGETICYSDIASSPIALAFFSALLVAHELDSKTFPNSSHAESNPEHTKE